MKKIYFLLLIPVLAIPAFFRVEEKNPVKFEIDENIVISPHLYIQMKDSHSLDISASRSEKNGDTIKMIDVTLKADNKLNLISDICEFDINDQTIRASENVQLKLYDGTELSTADVRIDMKKRILETRSGVRLRLGSYDVTGEALSAQLDDIKLSIIKPIIRYE